MSPSSFIQCSNPACLHAENFLGAQVCDRCQTPLVYRYLWAVGVGVEQIPNGTLVADRYRVIAPQVWLETQPALSPDVPPLPDIALPYLHLYPYRLYLPEAYGFCHRGEGSTGVLLLTNVPFDERGRFFAEIGAAWTQATAVRQVYWLWQLLELWTPLQKAGVTSSLLSSENLRVEGWRVRLRELYPDPETKPTLKNLAEVWLTWINQAQPQLVEPLQNLYQQMQGTENGEALLRTVALQLNQLLLEQAAQLPLRLKIAGATATGPQRSHNEDACYPLQSDLQSQPDPLLPHLAIICDGIGGHAGGEVASQLAVRSLQLQVRALISEVAEQTEIVSPDVIVQQLEAIIRVVNNLIAAQNDTQGRELRQRMGTTLVMALQLPQKVVTPTGTSNAHELYLAHVGDSRAYWMTPHHCQLLTVDDNVAVREVHLGRSLYSEALKRMDGGALTQALGTRDAETLYPTIQRFMLEEDGVLLLCSDGLSDDDLVERFWQQPTEQVFQGKMSLQEAAQFWINLANEQTGHDNSSVVVLQCYVSPGSPELFEPMTSPDLEETEAESELSESSRGLLYDENPEDARSQAGAPKKQKPLNLWVLALGLTVLMFAVGALGVTAWRRIDPLGFQQIWQRFILPPPKPPSQP